MARFVGSFTPPPTESDCRSHTNGDAVSDEASMASLDRTRLTQRWP